MYLKNKYTTWYNNIVTAAQSRTQITTTYVEVHHIVPRSLGGTDDPANLVKLTAKEHFVCHLLLTKMVTGISKRSMCYALWGMCNQKNKHQERHVVSGKSYQYAKDVASQSLSEERKGKTLEERYGFDKAQIIRQNLKTRKHRATPSIEELKDISDRVKKASRENPWTRNFEVNKQPKVICENCTMEVDIGNFSRSHGEKCRRQNKTCPTCNISFQTTLWEDKKYCSKICANRRRLLCH
jgi:hypothetical protein